MVSHGNNFRSLFVYIAVRVAKLLFENLEETNIFRFQFLRKIYLFISSIVRLFDRRKFYEISLRVSSNLSPRREISMQRYGDRSL